MKALPWRRAARPRIAAAVIAAVLGALLVAIAPTPATAAAPTVPLPQATEFEQPVTLLTASGDLSPGLTVYRATSLPKHFWTDGFTDATRSVTWSVSTTQKTSYRISLLANLGAGATLTLTSSAGAVTTITTTASGWARTDGGEIALPAGTSTLTLAHTSGTGQSIKSIELVPTDAWDDYQARVAAFKKASEATRVELSESGLGLMFQYGGWSFPATGANPDLETHTDDFDVEAFADLVQKAGADHVIWSITWWNYTMQAPISAVDDIVGNGNRTASRDLIGELADAFEKRGIMFFLYYHVGQDEHLGYNSTDFWQAQHWPDSFTTTGLGDRYTALDNWKKIVTQVGERYGTKLDGWFFDDGLVYYPANFEELGAVARAGNPARLVSWNNWVVADYTEFQDVAFGEEGCVNRPGPGSPAVGGDGIIVSGKDAGLLQHCMQPMEQDWGVHSADTVITTQRTAASLQCSVSDRLARNGAVSLNLMMHYPGVPSATSVTEIEKLAAATSAPEPGTLVNNTECGIAYSAGWATASNRTGAGDHLLDVTYTRTDGASFEYAFTGTGIDVLGPIDSGASVGDVYIDGDKVDSFSLTAPSYTPQSLLASVQGLPAGPHTVKVVRTGGSYLQLDALRITDASSEVAVDATVRGICRGSKVSLAVSVTNSDTSPVSAKVVTPNGSTEISSILAGKTAVATIKTNRRSIPDGTTTVTGSTQDGRVFTRTTDHAALRCR